MDTENLINSIRVASVDEGVPILEAVLNGAGWLFDRRDVRSDIQPYTQIRQALQSESVAVSERISRVCGKLLQKIIAKSSLLTAQGGENLFVVLRDCSPDITHIIVPQVCSSVFQGNPDQHARLLQILIAKSKKQNVQFWVTQNHLLGPKYAGVTFSGLLLHGMDIAAPYFATFFSDTGSLSNFIPIIAWLINNVGEHQTVQFLNRATAPCSPDLHAAMRQITEMFELPISIVSQPLFFGASTVVRPLEQHPLTVAHCTQKPWDTKDAKPADSCHQEWNETTGTNPGGWELAA